jgi:hypothetical protein
LWGINKAKRNTAFFFNEVSFKTLDRVEYLDLNQICIKSDELHDLFESRKSEIKSKINPTGIKTFSIDNVDLILKAIPENEKNTVKTQTEYLNYCLSD